MLQNRQFLLPFAFFCRFSAQTRCYEYFIEVKTENYIELCFHHARTNDSHAHRLQSCKLSIIRERAVVQLGFQSRQQPSGELDPVRRLFCCKSFRYLWIQCIGQEQPYKGDFSPSTASPDVCHYHESWRRNRGFSVSTECTDSNRTLKI